MSFPTYPKYNHSGVEWLGEVPEHWPLRRLGYYFDERREKVSDRDYPALSVTKNGIVPQLDTAAKTDDGDNRKRVCAGDFVINSRSDRKGSAGVADTDGSVSLICTVLSPRSAVLPAFIHHLLRSVPFQEEFYRYGKGIVADLWSTNYGEMRNILLALPPLPEQAAIASFLDRETAKIDALIAEQQRLVELLQEKRQAVISHAVTKGLNPDVPMKDSGIEWLGEVPEHWEVVRLGHRGRLQNGLSIGGEAFGAGDPFVSYGDVYNNATIPDPPAGLVRSSAQDQSKCSLEAGDVLFTRTSETVDDIGVASTCLRSIPRSTFAGFLIRFRPYQGIFDPGYSTYLFRNQGVQGHFAGTMNLVTRASLSQGELRCLPICIPPVEEQRQIASALDAQTHLLHSLVAEAERAITLLQERRSALISAAVTGEIDVRGLAGSEAA